MLEEMRRLQKTTWRAGGVHAHDTQRTLPLKAAQAGADELFLVPLN